MSVSTGFRVSVAVLAFLVFVPAWANADRTSGQIGGPPTLPVGGLFGKTGPEVVLGAGGKPSLRLEIVGFESKKRPCIFVAMVDRPFSFGGACNIDFLPPHGRKIDINSAGFGSLGTRGRRYTKVEGVLAPDVAEVRLTYRYRGTRRHAGAVVARVRHRLLATMNQTQPYGYFAAILKGCITSDVEAVALDQYGDIMDSTALSESPYEFSSPCPSGT